MPKKIKSQIQFHCFFFFLPGQNEFAEGYRKVVGEVGQGLGRGTAISSEKLAEGMGSGVFRTCGGSHVKTGWAWVALRRAIF
jgi:hypothetical protein